MFSIRLFKFLVNKMYLSLSEISSRENCESDEDEMSDSGVSWSLDRAKEI